HHPLKVSRDPPDRLSIVEIQAILQTARDSFCSFRQSQCEIKFSHTCFFTDLAHLQPFDLEFFSARVLQHHHDLKQRTPAQVPLRIDLLHQFLKWHVLVRICFQRYLFLPLDQFSETRIPSEVGPKDQRVDEKSDQPFDFFPGAVRDHGSDTEILLSA